MGSRRRLLRRGNILRKQQSWRYRSQQDDQHGSSQPLKLLSEEGMLYPPSTIDNSSQYAKVSWLNDFRMNWKYTVEDEMELWSCGQNAWGQLYFNQQYRHELPTEDLTKFICVLRDETIEILKTSISASLGKLLFLQQVLGFLITLFWYMVTCYGSWRTDPCLLWAIASFWRYCGHESSASIGSNFILISSRPFCLVTTSTNVYQPLSKRPMAFHPFWKKLAMLLYS